MVMNSNLGSSIVIQQPRSYKLSGSVIQLVLKAFTDRYSDL